MGSSCNESSIFLSESHRPPEVNEDEVLEWGRSGDVWGLGCFILWLYQGDGALACLAGLHEKTKEERQDIIQVWSYHDRH